MSALLPQQEQACQYSSREGHGRIHDPLPLTEELLTAGDFLGKDSVWPWQVDHISVDAQAYVNNTKWS